MSERPEFTTREYRDRVRRLAAMVVSQGKERNYVFTGSDVIRHDSVSRVSVADGKVRDWLAAYMNDHETGMCRMLVFPELSEIWIMIYGTDQASGDYSKTIALTYNYLKETWSRKTLPYINDTAFAPLAPRHTREHGIAWILHVIAITPFGILTVLKPPREP